MTASFPSVTPSAPPKLFVCIIAMSDPAPPKAQAAASRSAGIFWCTILLMHCKYIRLMSAFVITSTSMYIFIPAPPFCFNYTPLPRRNRSKVNASA